LQRDARSGRKGLTRSEVMQRITGADTKPEIALRKALWAVGLRYRLKSRVQGCRPDLVFPGPRLVIFVDGCFWHGCPEHYTMPRTRSGFWSEKLRANVERDRRQTIKLEEAGWRVLRVWEHELTGPAQVATATKSVADLIANRVQGFEKVDWRVLSVEPMTDDWSRERWHMEALRDPSKRRVITRRRAPQAVRRE